MKCTPVNKGKYGNLLEMDTLILIYLSNKTDSFWEIDQHIKFLNFKISKTVTDL